MANQDYTYKTFLDLWKQQGYNVTPEHYAKAKAYTAQKKAYDTLYEQANPGRKKAAQALKKRIGIDPGHGGSEYLAQVKKWKNEFNKKWGPEKKIKMKNPTDEYMKMIHSLKRK